ncbi:hypothetical protein FGO68_gene6211 [Halteria grandinella]|uniref:Transmembrane protein n=1 Tax=Halteria grandinella TaxID=5974 RepID=A0A8J8T5Z1_HALGN|nr:hypothetical protein FGO68_gene6211 [Halteria grandinella]
MGWQEIQQDSVQDKIYIKYINMQQKDMLNQKNTHTAAANKEILTDESLNQLSSIPKPNNNNSVSFVKHEDINPHEQSIDKLIDDLEHSKRGFISNEAQNALEISQISGFKNQKRSLKKQKSLSDKLKEKQSAREVKENSSSDSSSQGGETPKTHSKVLSSSSDNKQEKQPVSRKYDMPGDSISYESIEMQQTLKAKHRRLGSLLQIIKQRMQANGDESNYDGDLKILAMDDFKNYKSVKEVKNSFIKEALRKAMLGNMVDISEYNIYFNSTRFVRMFLYHLLLFYIGPLVGFIVWIIDGKGLALNTAFWYNKNMLPSFYQQMLLWLANMAFIIMWALTDPAMVNSGSRYKLTLGDFHQILHHRSPLCLLFRASIQSAKVLKSIFYVYIKGFTLCGLVSFQPKGWTYR